jgi:ketosteroid isomerase-like protein
MPFSITPMLFWTVAAVINNAQHADVTTDVHALVASEQAFARDVGKNGIQTGFLNYLAGDAMLFRPGPVAGRDWMMSRPASKGWLGWEPEFADVSRSGDIGYTTGPWSFRAKGVKDKPSAFGDYISIWRKQPDGTWKVEFDGGVSHAAPTAAPRTARVGAPKGRIVVRPSADPDSAKAELMAAESGLARMATSQGTGRAYTQFAASEVRLYREGAYPFLGKATIARLFDAAAPRPAWTVADARVSSAGDMGYTHGSYQTGAESGAFLRIWKRQPTGELRIVLDLTSPSPPPVKS